MATTLRFAAVMTVLAAPALDAQPRASERGQTVQTIDGTTITIDYARPSLRGRTPFGARVVRWGEVWTPGANWATTIAVSRDIRLDGKPLRKGKYAVWMVPHERGPWAVLFHADTTRFHEQRIDTTTAVLRVDVAPEQGPVMETLLWYFPAVQLDGGLLRMHWGSTMVPLRVAVEPTRFARVPSEERAAYLGRYTMSWTDPKDTTSSLVEIIATEGGMRGRTRPVFWKGLDEEFDFYASAPRVFRLGLHQGGKLFDAEEMFFRFTPATDGRTVLEVTDSKGEAYGRGVRVQ
jgi:hypothetical protein